MLKKQFIIYDATKAFARYIRLHLDDLYDFEVFHKHQLLYLKEEEDQYYDVAFVYVNSHDDLFALLWMIGKVDFIIVGYSTTFFEFMVNRIDGIQSINMIQPKCSMLDQLKQLIANNLLFQSL